MTKAELIRLLAFVDDSTKIILYDGDDSIFELSYYDYQPNDGLWLKISFATTVEDLD